jgi:predicted metal-dependent hydrolase
MAPTRIELAAIGVVATSSKPYRARVGILAGLIETSYPGAIERAAARIERERFESKFHGPVPAWAKKLVAKHRPDLIALRWRRSRTTLRGTCSSWSSEITVTERIGEPEQRMRILLLHEIAHFRGTGHDERFAAEFRRLLVAEGLYRAALKSGLTGQSKLRRVKAATRG